MKKITYICDRCGEKYEDVEVMADLHNGVKTFPIATVTITFEGRLPGRDDNIRKYEVCPHCAGYLMQAMEEFRNDDDGDI